MKALKSDGSPCKSGTRSGVCHFALACLTLLAFSFPTSTLASTGCQAIVTMPGTGSLNAQTFDIYQSGNCDDDQLGLFSGPGVPITNNPVGSDGPQTITSPSGNTYTLEWSGPNPDIYQIILVTQVATGPDTLALGYFYDDNGPNPAVTNATFTVTIGLPTIGPTVSGAPAIGTATGGDTYASITFTAPSSDGGSSISRYTATSSPGGFTGTSTNSPVFVSSLTNGTAYTFTVTATNSVGTGPASAASNSFTPGRTPDAPMIGTATAGDAQATVSFTAPASNGGSTISNYTVTASPGGASASGESSPVTVIGLANGTAYTFTVTATNAFGTGSASAASNSVTPLAAQTITFANPGAQSFGTAPTLIATSSSGLPVSFTSSTTGICTVTSGGTLTTVAAGSCCISADQSGNSDYSAAPRVVRRFSILAVVPGSPVIGSATAGDTQATVSFAVPASDGGASISDYTAASSPGGITGAGSASPITVTGLTNGTAYTFTVTATNSRGTGSQSAASNSVTPAAAQTIAFANPGAQNFGTTPVLTATASSELAVDFTSTTTNICTISPSGTLTLVAVGTCSINADQAGNETYAAAPAVAQSFAIVAVVPGAPAVGSASPGDAQAIVSFSPPSFTGGASVTGYSVTSLPGNLVATGSASPVTVTGLTNGSSYTFTVTATNSAGTGAGSGPSSSITPTPAPSGPGQNVAASAALPSSMHVTALASNGPFTAITIVDQPSSGQVVVNGLSILYLPDPNLATTQVVTFTYTLTNASGTSAPITVHITVTPATQKVSQLRFPPLWNRIFTPPPSKGAFLDQGGAA